MHYEDMTLEVSEFTTRIEDDRRLGAFKVRVLQSPAGEMAPGEAIMAEYNDKDLQSSLAKLDRRELDAPGLIAVGRTLAALLLPIVAKAGATSVRELFARSLVKVGPDDGLRLRLRLPADLAVIPWEYTYVERAGGEGINGFLAQDPRIAIVRHEVLASALDAPLLTGDIKVVTALAGAEGLPELNLDDEMKFLKEALSGLEGIQLQFCQHATLKELQPLLPRVGVFHFAGHGDFTRKMGARPGTYTGVGSLAFEDERVDAEQMGINLRGNGVRLAVLAGCDTGRRDGISVWSGIAPALVKAEIPAVVANQYTILDKCAIAFSHQFYQALAGGLPIERAVCAGRIAAYNADKGGRDWGVPVLYLRAADGQLFAGAADPQVRERCKQAAEVDVNVRASVVKAGGVLFGADVHRMVDGKLAVAVKVAGTVLGEVIGFRGINVEGGTVHAQVDVDVVAAGGKVTGARIDTLGGSRSSRTTRPAKKKSREPTESTPPISTVKRGKERTAPPGMRASVAVGDMTGGKIIGARVGSVAGDLDVTVQQVVHGDYVDARTIVAAGPEAVERIVRALMATQELDRRALQTAMARPAPKKVGRQIGAVIAAQRELAAGGAPVHPETAYRLGMLAAYGRDYATALSYFRQATEVDPEYSKAFFAISWLQQSRAMSDLDVLDYDAAVARLAEAREAAMHTDPLDGSAMALRGYISKTLAQVAESQHRAAERQKYYGDAARLFEQAAKLDPDNASAQNGLGNVQHALGNLDAAISAYRRAIELAPEYANAYHDLALALEAKMKAEPSAKGHWRERALEAWQEAYRLAPNDPGFSAEQVLALGQRIGWLRRQQDK
jgi:tetratricopeptide (TPR) repeat protein